MINREEAYNVLKDALPNEAGRDLSLFSASVDKSILQEAEQNYVKKGKWALERDLIFAYNRWKGSKK